MDSIISVFSDFGSIVSGIGPFDVLDIALVSVILYYAYQFIRERRAGKLAVGVFFLFAVMILSDVLSMRMLYYILSNIFQAGILSLIVLFQPEIRSALEKVGGEPLRSLRTIGEPTDISSTEAVIEEVSDAMAKLSAEHTGALLAFERQTKLGDVIRDGRSTKVNADVSSELLRNLFFNKAMLHDGAVIIANNRIDSAGCYLELSKRPDIEKDLGTRHRAGIGLSEQSDAVVVIVSEETGCITVAVDGRYTRGYNKETLKAELERLLIPENRKEKLKNRKKK